MVGGGGGLAVEEREGIKGPTWVAMVACVINALVGAENRKARAALHLGVLVTHGPSHHHSAALVICVTDTPVGAETEKPRQGQVIITPPQ